MDSAVSNTSRREIIYQSDDLTVVVYDCKTETVFATFNEMGLSAEGDRYWGARLFEGMGISAIGFVSARPNWYPLSSMLPAIERVRARFGARRIVTYGFSQGGYGALKFGNQLGSSLTLAFSPQWSIDPADVGNEDPRFTAYYDPKSRNGERIAQYDLGKRNFVLYDMRMRQDAFNAEKLTTLGGVDAVPIAFAGHSTINIISEGGIAKSLIRLCIEKTDIGARDIRALLRTARSRSATYAQVRVAQLEGSAKRHANFLRQALEALPEGPIRSMGFIRVYLSAGEHDEAHKSLESLSDQTLLEFDLLVLWAKFRSEGFRPGEMRIAPLFAQKYPDNVFARLHGVNSFVELQQSQPAIAELQALSSVRGADVHAGHFIGLYQKLGMPDDAARMARQFNDSRTVSRADRTRIGAELLQLYKKNAMRSAMFNELIAQADANAGNAERLLHLIDLALEIKSLSVVEHIILANPSLRRTHPVVEIYEAQCESSRDKFKGSNMALALFKKDDRSYHFWWTLSVAAEQLLGVDPAIEAAVKALKFADAAQSAKAHARLAHLYTYANRRRAALGHLKAIEKIRPPPLSMFSSLAKLALQNEKPKMATQFASCCLAAAPTDISVILQCCLVLVSAGEGPLASPDIQKIVARAEQGIRLTRPQFDDLLRCCQAIDFKLEQRVATLGATCFPDDSRLQLLTSKSRGSFAGKFFAPQFGT